MTRPCLSFRPLGLLLAGLPALLVAQSNTTSALSGTVRDGAGKPLAGAVVRLSSSSLIGGEKTGRTEGQGAYRFPALPPGLYKVVVEAAGFATIQSIEILELNRTTTSNFKIQASAGATVEVVAAVASVDAAPVGLNQNFNVESLNQLPYRRDLSSIMNLTPGVNTGLAWGGDRAGANAYLLDGINVGDPSGGSQWISPNPDWFQEVQVGGIGAPAEFGGFTGAFVNSIIKRGGNTLEGSFNAYYGSSAWRARSANPDPRLDKRVPDAKDWDVALNVGGPILKDKVWYFVSVERINNEASPIGAPVPVKTRNIRLLGKLTWQAATNATLEGFFDYDTVDQDNRGIDAVTEPRATLKETSPSRTFGLSWTQTIGSDQVLTVKATGFNGGYDLTSYNGEAYSLYVDAGYKGIWNYNNPYRVQQNFRSRNGISATYDLFKTSLLGTGDSHVFRMGIEREQAADEELGRFPGGIALNALVDSYSPYPQTDYIQVGGGWNIRARLDRTAAFLQDNWTVNGRLSIQPGLRFERFQGRSYGASGLWDTRTLAPRLGVSFGLTADQTQVLKAHWGRFYEGLAVMHFDRAMPGAFPVENRYYWGDYTPILDPHNPLASEPLPSQTPGNFYKRIDDSSRLDPNIKHPYMDELSLAYEAKLGGPWGLTITAVQRRNHDILTRLDNALTGGFTATVTDGLTGNVIPVYKQTSNPSVHDYFITNNSEAEREYRAYTVAVERKFQDNWMLAGSYTHARSNGNVSATNGYDNSFSNPNLRINNYGALPGTNDNEVKLRGSYVLPSRTRLSGTFTYLSGEHWTRTIRTGKLPVDRYVIKADPTGASTYPGRTQLDLRLAQEFQPSKRVRIEAFVDVYNALNGGKATNLTTRSDSADYLLPLAVQDSRNVRLGFRTSF
jgi:hypothetical protein